LGRALVVAVDKVGICGDGEDIHPQARGQQGGGPVLINHRFHSLQCSIAAHYGNAAATHGDNQHAVIDQIPDNLQFDDINGLGGRNHTAVATGGILHDVPTKGLLALLGVGSRVEGANGLGRVPHGGIIARYHGLSNQAHEGNLQAGSIQFIVQRLAKQVADFPLGGRATDVKRKAGNLVGSALGAQQVGANLGAVTVSDDQAIAVTNQPNDGGSGAPCVRQLFGNGSLLPSADEGVAADGDEHCPWHKQCLG